MSPPSAGSSLAYARSSVTRERLAPPPASSARCRHAAAAAAGSARTVAPPRRKCASCRRRASPRSTQAERRNRKRTAGAPASPFGRPRASPHAPSFQRGSPPKFHERRPRPAASGERRIDRRRHRSGAGVGRLCVCMRATAPFRHGRRTTAPRRWALLRRGERRLDALSGLGLALDQLGVAHPAHLVHSHRHSPSRSRGAFLRPGGVLVIASTPTRGGRSADPPSSHPHVASDRPRPL